MKERQRLIFFNFMGLSAATILLSAFLLTLFGVVDLRHITTIKVNVFIDCLISFILYTINTLVVCRFCLKTFSFIGSTFIFLYLTSFIIFNIFIPPNLITSTAIPILILFIFSFKFKVKTSKIIKRLAILMVITGIYQQVALYIKTYFIGVDFYNPNSIVGLIFSIDLFLFYYFILKGDVINELELDGQLVVFSKVKRIFQTKKHCKESIDTSDLTKRQKVFFAFMVMGYQIIQLLVVLAIGIFNNMFIELIAMLAMFWIGRAILQKSWHSDKLWICSVATFSGFYVLTKVTPPFEISLFLIVALTGLFVYLLHILGVKSDRLEELEEENPKLKATITPEIELRAKLTSTNLTDMQRQICIDWKIYKHTRKQQAQTHGIGIDNVRYHRDVISKALTNNNIVV